MTTFNTKKAMNMKKMIYRTFAACACAVFSLSCTSDMLDTAPAGQLSADVIFSDPNKAQSAVNGIYRLMYTNGWSDNWSHENPGLAGFTIVRSLMGEDHFMASQGQGWFFFDYMFGVSTDWTSKSGRQYATWNLFYTLISQANYVIDHCDTLSQSPEGNNVLGQAYAVRAYCYYCLYESFCQGNYSENKEAPGVPVYTTGTNKNTNGVGRGTVEGLFEQINGDFGKSIECFEAGNAESESITNLDVYSAYGLWARASLGQQNYEQAAVCAAEALKKPGLNRVATLGELGYFNTASVSDVMWAFEIPADQASQFGGFFSHLDRDGGYGSVAPQCIDYWLYEEGMSDTDLRRSWAEYTPTKVSYYYWQTKFKYKNLKTAEGDIINMRAEEMLLTLAECECRAGNYTEARALLGELYEQRYSEERDIASLRDAATVSPDTHAAPVTLLDEILLQRRIELWCEGMGRVPDLRRLNLGYSRSSLQPSAYQMSANAPDFILSIPLSEFDSNPALDLATDQN